jgi:hypothetical protein
LIGLALEYMADITDSASDEECLLRDAKIAEIRNLKPVKFTGHCLYCNETITQGRFCCSECREDWEMAEKFNKILGKS